MLERVRKQVEVLLQEDHSGHGMEHVTRVLDLALKFAEVENADKDLVSLIVLLHDVDDYKLFGEESQKNFTNAKNIMNSVGVSIQDQEKVCEALSTIGYSKRLKGLVPKTIEAKVVADADMCDGIGAVGILRGFQFGISIDRPFFVSDVFPVDFMSYDYHKQKTVSTVNFMIESLLTYKDLMLTSMGQKEAQKRHDIMVQFLYHFFEEENEQAWITYLDKYLEKKKENQD